MAELLSTIPGDIPGLLRRGSPLVYSRFTASRAVVGETHGPQWREDNGPWQPCETWLLDLTDATGRAHAAAWADKATTYNTVEFMQRLDAGMLPSLDERRAMDLGMRFADMTAREIDTLARLCLRLAGRSHV